MNSLFKALLLSAVALACFTQQSAVAESVVEQNSNVVGRTIPGYYRGIPGMQDNEPSCAINPILAYNIVCAWNASGGSDDLIGDTWLRFSESLDGGRNFYNRYLRGSNLDPATSALQQFAADPVMMCWPGGCGTFMLASTRAEGGGQGGGIYLQRMADMNTETGFRKALKTTLDQVYRSTGSHFADKPHATYILDEDNPGTVTVEFEAELPDGSIETLSREWPKARIILVFALFNPSKTDIQILSTFTDDYGQNWSNPRQIAQTSGRDQGVSISAMGDTVFYGFRRFESGKETDDIMGVVSNDRGRRHSKPFIVAEDVCVYDVPTLPSDVNQTSASSRTNDFPWVSNDGSQFIMTYSERRRSPDGGCLTDSSAPSDSRIMAVAGSSNGRNWSEPVEIDPRAEHGFQFMPVVECSLGDCQVGYWDSIRDSQRTLNYLQSNAATIPDWSNAWAAFQSVPILADFNYPLTSGKIMQFRRTADMRTKTIRLTPGGIDISEPSVQVSSYRQIPWNGGLADVEFNPFNVKAYKSNTVPFMSDYSSMSTLRHRFVFDPQNPEQEPFWESNAGPDPLHPNAVPYFWLAWTDARNMRGQLYTEQINGQPPYTRTPQPMMAVSDDEAQVVKSPELAAESVEDFNPGAGFCTPVANPGAGAYFPALNNRVKDSDIYGAGIRNVATAYAINPTKTLGLIQRTYTIVSANTENTGRVFRFEIVNQPLGFPQESRASWKQLPFDPAEPDFPTTPPETITLEAVGPLSSASVALFLVSEAPVNPVTVEIYDNNTNELINSIVVNGAVEAGPLLNPDGTVNTLEIHNPLVYAPDPFNPDHYNLDHYNPDQFNPDQFNPDQYNPDQFNPDLFNPDLFNPDQFNPDQFNPDQFNPDQFNPDQFNPDQFNPDQFNPDQFNPDQFNPDQFNTNLTDSDMLHNPEIPDPDLSTVTRNPDGTVVKLDVNFGIQNVGNTLTPYSVDFAVTDPDILNLLENGEIATQLIAWQNKQIDDVQFCTPRLSTENRVVSAENNPDLAALEIPTILDNRAGALTYFVAPNDILQNTIRFIGPLDKMQIVANALRNDVISYVFTAQTANTGEYSLVADREQILNDRTPAVFNLTGGSTSVLEAYGPAGAILPVDFVTADRNGEPVPVSCSPALGSIVPLNIDNGGPTSLSCSATTDNGVTSTLDMQVSVLDTLEPIIDPGTVPADIVAEAQSSSGATVTYTYPTAGDQFGVDPSPVVSCVPDSGFEFPLASPGPMTTVTCTATDESGNVSDPETFEVTIQDTTEPQFQDFNPPIFIPPDARRVLGDNDSTFALQWGPFTVLDASPNLIVTCVPGSPVGGIQPPQYAFSHNFPPGITPITCTATDAGGQQASASFDVEVFDETAPVITLNGDATITIDLGDSYTDPGATATDNADGDVSVSIDDGAVNTAAEGTYSVVISASDSSGNIAEVTRTVVVEFSYGTTGIIPTKTSVKVGSSNPLIWAWLNPDGSVADSSGDVQDLSIRNCETNEIVLQMAGDPGSSGFRFKSDNWWQFNWETAGDKGQRYCAAVTSGRTGQTQFSPPIRLR